MSQNTFELGVKVQDKITGFSGIATSRVEYLTGCTQYGVVPRVGTDGKVPDTQYFDEGRLVEVEQGIDAASVAGPRNGGPNRDAPPT